MHEECGRRLQETRIKSANIKPLSDEIKRMELKLMVDLNRIATEQRNQDTLDIDRVSTLDMVREINREDAKIAGAVELVLPQIAEAIDRTAQRLARGGRLIYVGAGTSGRLGILDASECPPTYSAPPEMVQGLIAGGYPAIFKAVEGAEDSRELGREDLIRLNLCADDVVGGLAASGRTPYVIGALTYAKEIGALTLGITCCAGSEIDTLSDIGIAPMPGPEAITGSTRMKSGTAQKMVLNMLSTGVMVRLGKVYSNLMVDVQPSNEKLVQRCIRIVREATHADEARAREALEKSGYHCKTAIVMIELDCDAQQARDALERAGGRVSLALGKN